MAAHFSVLAQRELGLLRIVMRGFFFEHDVEELARSLNRNIRLLDCPPNTHRTLCDIREMSIQSRTIVEKFATLVNDPASRSSQLAFVTGSSLSRAQARRLTARADVEYFTNVEAAEAWLLAKLRAKPHVSYGSAA